MFESPRRFFGPAVLGLLAVCLSPPVSAQDSTWSVAVGIGATRFQANDAGIAREFPGLRPGFDVRESTTAFRASGSYQFDRYLALDLDVVELGDVIAEDTAGRHKLFSVAGVVAAARARGSLSERLIGFARLGAFLWTSSVNIDDTVDDGLDLTLGLGLDFNVYGGWERVLRLQWDHFGFNGVTLDSADLLAASLVFNF